MVGGGEEGVAVERAVVSEGVGGSGAVRGADMGAVGGSGGRGGKDTVIERFPGGGGGGRRVGNLSKEPVREVTGLGDTTCSEGSFGTTEGPAFVVLAASLLCSVFCFSSCPWTALSTPTACLSAGLPLPSLPLASDASHSVAKIKIINK